MIVFATLTSFVVSRTGVKPLAVAGAGITALGFYLVSIASTLLQALAFELVIGAGMALLNASVINLLVLTVDPKDMGQATAMNNVFRNIGGSVGAPIAASLLTTFVVTSGPFAGFGLPSHLAFQYAFWIAAVVTLVGGLTILFGHEVLGPARHARFAHLPVLLRRVSRRGNGSSSVPPSNSPVGSPETPVRANGPSPKPSGGPDAQVSRVGSS
jgi:MFS family permease